MKRMFIKPLDVLMFRYERPFIARESHVAKLGVLSPLTFEGALKSKIFLDFCKKRNYSPLDFQRERGRNETREGFEKSLKRLRETVENKLKDDELREILEIIGYSPLNYYSKINVLGVFFSEKGRGECFPIPNDIVKNENRFLKSNPLLKDEVKIAGTEKYACISKDSRVEGINGLFSFDALVEYLHGIEPNKSWFIEKPYELEVRTGIELENGTKRTVEGHLYTAEFLRLKLKNWEDSWEFSLWVEDRDEILEQYFKENEVIRLGGEAKGAVCEKISDIDLSDKFRTPIEEINGEKKFKLYLATPSYFNGHEPPINKLKEILKVEKLTLVASLTGKPIYIGGYDFAFNKEKRLQRWVNAGAVYYYKFEGQITKDLSLPVIDANIDMRCAFIGRW